MLTLSGSRDRRRGPEELGVQRKADAEDESEFCACPAADGGWIVLLVTEVRTKGETARV